MYIKKYSTRTNFISKEHEETGVITGVVTGIVNFTDGRCDYFFKGTISEMK